MSGYIANDGENWRLVAGEAPALVQIQSESSPRRIAIQVLALLAYPKLDEKESARRLEAMQAFGAWHWRSMVEFGRIPIGKMPDWAKAWRKDRLLARCEKTTRHVNTRLDAAGMAWKLGVRAAESRALRIRVGGKPPNIKWLSEVESRKRRADDQTENIRNRTWYASRPVLHLAHELRLLLDARPEDDLASLLADPSWAQDLMTRAEKCRRMMLPLAGVPVERSIQLA